MRIVNEGSTFFDTEIEFEWTAGFVACGEGDVLQVAFGVGDLRKSAYASRPFPCRFRVGVEIYGGFLHALLYH